MTLIAETLSNHQKGFEPRQQHKEDKSAANSKCIENKSQIKYRKMHNYLLIKPKTLLCPVIIISKAYHAQSNCQEIDAVRK